MNLQRERRRQLGVEGRADDRGRELLVDQVEPLHHILVLRLDRVRFLPREIPVAIFREIHELLVVQRPDVRNVGEHGVVVGLHAHVAKEFIHRDLEIHEFRIDLVELPGHLVELCLDVGHGVVALDEVDDPADSLLGRGARRPVEDLLENPLEDAPAFPQQPGEGVRRAGKRLVDERIDIVVERLSRRRPFAEELRERKDILVRPRKERRGGDVRGQFDESGDRMFRLRERRAGFERVPRDERRQRRDRDEHVRGRIFDEPRDHERIRRVRLSRAVRFDARDRDDEAHRDVARERDGKLARFGVDRSRSSRNVTAVRRAHRHGSRPHFAAARIPASPDDRMSALAVSDAAPASEEERAEKEHERNQAKDDAFGDTWCGVTKSKHGIASLV